MEIDVNDPHKLVACKCQAFLERRLSGCKNEVEKYLAKNPEGRNDAKFDILDWWKNNVNRYPMLAQVVRDVFPVFSFTASSESAFSTEVRTLDPFQSSLSSLMVQCLVCT